MPEGNRETKRERRRKIVSEREKIEGAAWYETKMEEEGWVVGGAGVEGVCLVRELTVMLY